MHYSTQNIELIQSESNDKTAFRAKKIDTEVKNKGLTAPLFKANNEREENAVEQYEISGIRKYSSTATSCTSSTDSGVNMSDNEETTPSSPTSSHFHSSSISSSETATTAANLACYKQLHESHKNTNRDNNVENKSNNKNKNNNNIFNADKDFDHHEEKDSISIAVEGNSRGINSRYLPNQNSIESKNVININQEPNVTTSTTITDKPPLRHNEFFKFSQRPPSTSSSLSMSSTIDSSNDCTSSTLHHCNASPVVSIRSICSSIIISDSDSDLDSDTEGVHENYVIKKLGTQTTYSPNDPSIPNINSGKTVLNQKVILNDDQAPLPQLATLAAIGDRIGAAHALGPTPSNLAVAQRPQIGSIALSNSTDVTFGDKHFYEGPVTIQQFLIDGRDKSKESDEKDNPTFENGDIENFKGNAKDENSSEEKSSKLYEYVLKRKKLIIPGALAIMALLIAASILGSMTLNDKNTDDDDEYCDSNGTICIIERDTWRAQPLNNSLDKQKLPLHRVVISHTATEPCDSIKVCSYRLRVIQEFHKSSMGWDDIAYNFLISSEGRVYVGRGWDLVGAHTKGYNYDSVGISFIGTYMTTPPTTAQLNATLSLLEIGLDLQKLVPDYRLYGARQLGATESPGDILYRVIKKWPHWSDSIDL